MRNSESNIWPKAEATILYLTALAMPVSIAVANLAFGLGLLLLIRRAFTGGLWDSGIFNPVTFLIVVWVCGLTFSLWISQYGQNWAGFAEDRWVLVAAFLPFALVRNVESGAKALYLLMISGLVTAAYALFENLSAYDPLRDKFLETHGGGAMAVGFFTHHLTYAGIALLILAIAVSWGLYGPGRRKPIYAVFVTLLSAVGLFSTFARSAVIGLGGMGLGLLTTAPKKLRLWIAGVGVAGVLGLLAIAPGMMTRFSYMFESGIDESPRLRLWQTSLNLIEANPFFGVGQGNWKYAFAEHKIPGRYVSAAHPHCDILSSGVDGGLIGMVLFLWIWVSFFFIAGRSLKGLHHSHPARWGIVAGISGIAGILLAGLFQNYLTDAEVGNIAWFMVGMTLRMGFLAAQPVAIPPPLEESRLIYPPTARGWRKYFWGGVKE